MRTSTTVTRSPRSSMSHKVLASMFSCATIASPFYPSTGTPLLQQDPHHPHNGADGDHDIDRDLEPLQHHEGDHRHDEGKEVQPRQGDTFGEQDLRGEEDG